MNKENAASAKAGGGFGKILLIALAGVVLVGAGGFAGSFFGNDAAPAAGSPAAAPPPSSGPALYASLQPPLVVNFRDSSGDSHYMQVTLEIMARDQKVIDAVKQHAAAIRNNLILLFSDTVDYAAMNTREHKEQMLADALAEVRSVMRERGTEGIEAVYFTGLIVQ